MWQLYVILDAAAAAGRNLQDLTAAAIRGGADLLQLRDKTASTKQLCDTAQQLLPLTRAAGIPLIINDRVDVALAVGADGVHLGQDDLAPALARRLLGPHRLIGQSTHSLEQALAAQREPIDYFAVGPIFATPTKPDYPHVGLSLIRQIAPHARKPFVAIGGIDLDVAPSVLDAGAPGVAVVRAVCAAADPEAATRQLKRLFAQFVPTRSQAPL